MGGVGHFRLRYSSDNNDFHTVLALCHSYHPNPCIPQDGTSERKAPSRDDTATAGAGSSGVATEFSMTMFPQKLKMPTLPL